MSDALSAERLAEIRARHAPFGDGPFDNCRTCDRTWPCDAIQVCDAYDALQSGIDRAVLELTSAKGVGWPVATLIENIQHVLREKQAAEQAIYGGQQLVDQLRAQLAAAEARVREVEAKLAGKSVTQYDADKETIARMRAALEQYGTHYERCMSRQFLSCTCGFDKALTGQEGA